MKPRDKLIRIQKNEWLVSCVTLCVCVCVCVRARACACGCVRVIVPPSLTGRDQKARDTIKTGFSGCCPHLVVDSPEPHDCVVPIGDELGVVFGDSDREVLGTHSALEKVGDEPLHRLNPAETPAQEHIQIRA